MFLLLENANAPVHGSPVTKVLRFRTPFTRSVRVAHKLTNGRVNCVKSLLAAATEPQSHS
jgi:hypothetical protein